MLGVASLLSLLLSLVLTDVETRSQLRGRQGKVPGGASLTFTTNTPQANQQAQLAQSRGAIGTASDGSKILAMTADVENFAVQFKVSAPPDFLLGPAQNGAVIRATDQVAIQSQGDLGINVLLHGDGGQTFFDFSNQAVQNKLMGIVLLAPNDKMFWGGGAGSLRSDGDLHSRLVDRVITQVLPQVINMDPRRIFFTGVSGGSNLLAGFFMPLFAEKYNTGAIFGCGGLPPQVTPSENFGRTLGTMRIHFQTTTDELTSLQSTIPGAILAYVTAAQNSGVDRQVLGKMLTADATPKGSHCAFDGKDFVRGVQLMSDTYGTVIFGDGNAKGLGSVSTSALTNSQIFSSGIPVAKASAKTLTGKATRP